MCCFAVTCSSECMTKLFCRSYFMSCVLCLMFVSSFQFFLCPPLCSPQPRWYSAKFSTIFDTFGSVISPSPTNLHVTSLYKTDPSMFELDGRHLKSFVGKDLIDHLLACVESGLVRVDLDSESHGAEVDNRLALIEGRVDLVSRDLARSDQRLDVVVARAAEDGDAALNEK